MANRKVKKPVMMSKVAALEFGMAATDVMVKCGRCGYEWEKRIADPRECPQCKSRNYKHPRKGALRQGGKDSMRRFLKKEAT
jgi:predicted Zn-ribbon and HTH transcriptional regulator